MNLKKILTLILFLFLIIAASPQTKVPVKDADKYLGQTVTNVGTVDEVHLTKSGTYFLNMGASYPNQTFTAVIFKSDASTFTDVEKYEGKEVEITGKIQEYKGKPEIILKKPEQIKLKEN